MNGDQQQKQDQPAVESGAAGPGGTSWARSSDYPNGSTSRMRADVLAALGVLKVATADQLQRITRPGLKSNKALRAALLDLGLHGLTLSEGRTTTRDKLWRLTPAGLDAAAEVLPAGRDLGGTARGAGRTGAPHSVMVNETIAAILAGGTAPDAGPGTGTITDWSTETVHEIGPRLRAITDAVLRAPQAGVPVLLVEVDRGTMTPEAVAAKFERYQLFFRREAKRAGETVPYWHLLYGTPPRSHWDEHDPYPPVALVLGGNLGRTALTNRLQRIEELTRPWWKPRWMRGHGDDYYADYSDRIPILITTLEHLRTFGLAGPAWHRCGRDGRQTLAAALADPDGYSAYQERSWREHEERRARDQERDQERHRCPTCNRRPDEYDDPDDASPNGTDDCEPCRQTAHDEYEATQKAERAQELRDAEARDRCVTCTTGLIENNLIDHDPEAIECWTCYQNRSFRGEPPLRRPAEQPKKKRWFKTE
ncbi:replication-relaxation family protein [Kitasatospora herbaricolor]|uniref:Replication-relaxation family protein n=1 Tax=Kitasatospora herbaricolor TaxID=68217 RepID=A0ABZ1WLM4_9ACTN|nr:replication-relaxation family protein [Kitasatospora herbaricolor]